MNWKMYAPYNNWMELSQSKKYKSNEFFKLEENSDFFFWMPRRS